MRSKDHKRIVIRYSDLPESTIKSVFEVAYDCYLENKPWPGTDMFEFATANLAFYIWKYDVFPTTRNFVAAGLVMFRQYMTQPPEDLPFIVLRLRYYIELAREILSWETAEAMRIAVNRMRHDEEIQKILRTR